MEFRSRRKFLWDDQVRAAWKALGNCLRRELGPCGPVGSISTSSSAQAWGLLMQETRGPGEEKVLCILLSPAGSRGRCAAIKVSLEDPSEGILPVIRAPKGTASRRPPPASVALAGEQILVGSWWVAKGLAFRPETWKEHRWKTGDEVGLRETLVDLVDGHVEDVCGPCQYPRGAWAWGLNIQGPKRGPSYGYQPVLSFNQPDACSLDPCKRGNI